MMAIEVRSFTMLPGMVGAEAPISVKIAGQVFAILITCPFSMLSSEEVGFARNTPGGADSSRPGAPAVLRKVGLQDPIAVAVPLLCVDSGDAAPTGRSATLSRSSPAAGLCSASGPSL